ncbi:unnamed protein product [Rotaria magnacalcarata]|uniref:Uncharacterized protein n=1 Tax=Rotaria magnacalcarata TaxID=392030 RepID=A0A816WH89_9BILA|nr:unnamed protein product [Rotaria magnacalcarata]
MNDKGFLYISDFEKHEVGQYQIGETNGTLVAGAIGKGDHLNQLNRCNRVFIDRDYSVYVFDLWNHRVMKWAKSAKEGTVVAGDRGDGNALTQLSCPQAVLFDSLGIVYVAD